ncbi:MAG: hypothetical protein NWF11_05855 [Candidatus Bathyarchaeota archaeon]|nr:hypothetical protein [Candidatus Bathyarchaeota archaeon]
MSELEARKCAKCGAAMINEELEWKCPKCGNTECIEPEYCPPKNE